MKKTAKIYVAGHNGLVGSAIVRNLCAKGYTNIIVKTRSQLDLLNEELVKQFFYKEKPEFVFLAAAKVGGILANETYPANFIYENLVIQNNVLHNAFKHSVKKLLFLGSSCIYPKQSPQPIKEDYLLTGLLEATNEPYAIAKIAGIKMCQAYHKQYGINFISVMPTNLYGPNDNFDPERSHVVPALIQKFHRAKKQQAKHVVLWGTGKAKREFLYVDDVADAVVFLMNTYDKPDIVNIGTGKDITISELAELVKNAVGYDGKITWDPSKPEGTPRKQLDVSRIHGLGWKHRTRLQEGIASTYTWYQHSLSKISSRDRAGISN